MSVLVDRVVSDRLMLVAPSDIMVDPSMPILVGEDYSLAHHQRYGKTLVLADVWTQYDEGSLRGGRSGVKTGELESREWGTLQRRYPAVRVDEETRIVPSDQYRPSRGTL